MGSRENILGRLRNATRGDGNASPRLAADCELFRDYPGDPGREALAELFAERLQALKGEFLRVANERDAAKALAELLEGTDLRRVVAHPDPLIDAVLDHLEGGSQVASDGAALRLDSPRLARYDVGITGADYLIARTGSVVVSSGSRGGRRLSVLPPCHVVLATAERLVPSLEDVFSGRDIFRRSSSVTLASGPSRTADIEKILVLGAHGPRRLVVVFIG